MNKNKLLRVACWSVAVLALIIIENLITYADEELYPWAEYAKYAFYLVFAFLLYKFVFSKPKVNKENIPRYGQEQDQEK